MLRFPESLTIFLSTQSLNVSRPERPLWLRKLVNSNSCPECGAKAPPVKRNGEKVVGMIWHSM